MEAVEWIWKDGEFVPWDQANTHVLTHSLHYGFSVFEGIRCYSQPDGAAGIFRLKEHLARLLESAHICMMDVDLTVEAMTAACCELVAKNNLHDGCYLRPLVYLGAGSMGIAAMDNPVHVVIASWRWGAYLGADGLENGVRTMISGYRRAPADVLMSKGKITGQYVTSILAKREALKAGFDEALMCDSSGCVVEGTGENLFMVKNGQVRTPGLGEAILGGITRDTVLTLLRDEGVEVREGPIGRDELYCADEVFLTGSAAEVTPVREIDHRAIGGGRPGAITQHLQKRYADLVHGRLDQYSEMITRVER